MGDWQELGQAVFIGLIFSFLVAKLISTVLSFREDHLRLARDDRLAEPRDFPEENTGVAGKEKSPLGESKEVEVEDEEEWEGVESTELDEAFSAASAFAAATAANRMAPKVSTDVQLQLYGLYKIATEGPCTAPQPSALKVTSRAKWNAWQKLGAMPPEEAMQKYITIITELYPTWAKKSGVEQKEEGTALASDSSNKGTKGPVFSSFVHEEESETDLRLENIHIFAREGNSKDLLSSFEDGVSVNLTDSEGRTPLHWAVDRGHFDVVKILIDKNADVNAKDNEGQTPLHYAVLCEREAIAELLVKHNANPDMKDADGNSPGDLCQPLWDFMSPPR